MQVLPAIIPRNKDQLEEEIRRVAGFANLIQIDISDGIFTPYKTWPYNGNNTDYFEQLKKQEIGWPRWEDVDVEVHLMVKYPEQVVQDWINSGVSGVVAHIEATEDFQKVIDICKENMVSIGIAIKPSTDISKLTAFAEQVDFIQVMGNDLLGKHGVELEEEAISKIKNLRELYPQSIIAIDIGVSLETKDELVSAGANKLISGGAILESANPEEVWSELSS